MSGMQMHMLPCASRTMCTEQKRQSQQQGSKNRSIGTNPERSGTQVADKVDVIRHAQGNNGSCSRKAIVEHKSSEATTVGPSDLSKRGQAEAKRVSKNETRDELAASTATTESTTEEDSALVESAALEMEASSAEVEDVSTPATVLPTQRSLNKQKAMPPIRRSQRKRKSVSYAERDHDDIPNSKAKGYVILDNVGSKNEAVALPALKPVVCNWDGNKVLCSICGEGQSADDSNSMIYCNGDGCGVAVHPQCHGLEDAPLGLWLCDGCRDGLCPQNANCVLCPVVGGAVTKVHSQGEVTVPQRPQDRLYVHIVCALWVEEVHFAEPDRLSGILLDEMTHVRAGLKCTMCKQAGGGAIQCRYGNCCKAFHALCARSKGWVVSFCRDGSTAQFCGRHSAGKSFALERRAILNCGSSSSTSSSGGAAMSTDGGSEGSDSANEYEEERRQNIERNRTYLEGLCEG
ncbi:unnamed protein product [Ostreobium quekettii]|uniref:PHD-type domain-containing protein n=1 Tax=Ostreobium quekettii TaxID=121088 RepID=A0A8S1IW13_9CHLO|nr:unnamed protein product [Ostreobium quekettii]